MEKNSILSEKIAQSLNDLIQTKLDLFSRRAPADLDQSFLVSKIKFTPDEVDDLIRRVASQVNEEAVQKIERYKQAMYIIFHNFISPVNSLRSLCMLLKSEYKGVGESQLYFDKIKNTLDKMVGVLKDIEALVETEGNAAQTFSVVNMKELVESIGVLEDNFGSHEVVTRFGEDAEEICSVKPYLHSIIENLVVNSIRYRDPRRKLRIEITNQKKNGYFIIRLADNGTGIDLSKHRDKIFELHSSLDAGNKGLGIGLFLVRSQVELLGGKIDVVSKVGEGTEFIIELPEVRKQDS
jgi:signal transduction histidine kinase